MLPSSHTHLNEIAKILSNVILRLEAAKTETKEIDKRYNGYLLDFVPHSSVTEDPLELKPERRSQ